MWTSFTSTSPLAVGKKQKDVITNRYIVLLHKNHKTPCGAASRSSAAQLLRSPGGEEDVRCNLIFEAELRAAYSHITSKRIGWLRNIMRLRQRPQDRWMVWHFGRILISTTRLREAKKKNNQLHWWPLTRHNIINTKLRILYWTWAYRFFLYLSKLNQVLVCEELT